MEILEPSDFGNRSIIDLLHAVIIDCQSSPIPQTDLVSPFITFRLVRFDLVNRKSLKLAMFMFYSVRSSWPL